MRIGLLLIFRRTAEFYKDSFVKNTCGIISGTA